MSPAAPSGGAEPAIFQGNQRFTIRQRIGEGGMGVVYRAYDHELASEVALKTLRAFDAAAIYRFKREFRSLADISHRNLVSLHELVSANGAWFFTMELVVGVDLLSWVRPPYPPAGAGYDDGNLTTQIRTESATPGALSSAQAELARRSMPRPIDQTARFDEPKLRGALKELAEGVVTLHENGRFHRDIKPSNVLVTREGRVVLLDFGLVTMLAEESGDPEMMSNHIVGTIGYMAPEQAAGMPVTAASDWYSVGVILFEALTGQRPFVGAPFDVLAAKQNIEPPRPADLVPGVPRDLDALCTALIARDPRTRPDGGTVMKLLGVVPSLRPVSRADRRGSAAGSPRSASRAGADLLVGRDPHMKALFDAYRATRQERAVLIYVSGSSGMGKSALVRRFIDAVLERDAALVFKGRCYERESVPFKAFDDVIDALCRHFMRLSASEAKALLPPDVAHLARVFPALLRVKAIREAAGGAAEAVDLHERRRRAFFALREVLERLAAKRPVIVHIDDLQWGDLDSAVLLKDLLSPPDPPAVLFVGCYRAEDVETNAALRALLEVPAEARADVRSLRLEPLSESEARTLVDALLPDDSETTVEPNAIVREAGGNPFFVHELVQHARRRPPRGESAPRRGEIAFDEVLASRLDRLPAEALRLLEAICVCGRPIPRGVALKAASGSSATSLVLLITERLIRTRVFGEDEAVEAYHDRIREGLVRRLEPSVLAGCHRGLAAALEASKPADPEALVEHLLAGGEADRAGRFAAIAADEAAEMLAFDRAARLYRIAIAPRSDAGLEIGDLYYRLATALSNAGRGREAADAYQRSAERVAALAVGPSGGPRVALDRRRMAAEQLLRSGHIDEGLVVLEGVLRDVGMALSPTPKRTLASLLLRRGQVRLRGLGFQERTAAEIPEADLSRIDLLGSVAMGLSMVDVARGSDFQSRHLLLALKAGEPYRVARALAMEACYSATGGGSTRARTATLVKATAALSARLQLPHALGLARYAEGVGAFLEGRFSDARAAAADAERIFRDRCTGVAWEVASAQIFHLASVGFIGDLPALSKAVRQNLREAEERGDRYASGNLRSGPGNLAWLIAGDPPRRARTTRRYNGRLVAERLSPPTLLRSDRPRRDRPVLWIWSVRIPADDRSMARPRAIALAELPIRPDRLPVDARPHRASSRARGARRPRLIARRGGESGAADRAREDALVEPDRLDAPRRRARPARRAGGGGGALRQGHARLRGERHGAV